MPDHDASAPGPPPDRLRTPSPQLVRRATPADAEAIADTLGVAFLDCEWSRWAVPADGRLRRLRALHLLYAGLSGTQAGTTWVTDDVSSVASWVAPGSPPPPAWLRERLDREVPDLFGDRHEALDALDGETAQLRPAEPHWYLATVGTRPERRRQGLGTLVIRPGLAICDETSMQAAVETSSETNVALYERLGFNIAGDRRSGDGGLRVWVLVRPPGARPRP
jgi:ribosomal protein S18 acetylase RimI-like enzyme